MSKLQVHLLGRFRVFRDERPVAGVDSHKVQELFSYLLLKREHRHLRPTLSELLWNDSSASQSRKYLRQVLWQLQSALESHAETAGHRILTIEADRIDLNGEVDLWLDVAVLELAFARVAAVPGGSLTAETVALLEESVQLYQGDLLEGFYEDWCIVERERLQVIYLSLLDRLMGYCERHQLCERGLGYGRRILEHDRASERTHRRMMGLYYLAGDRTAGLRQYERCVAALREEFDAPPSRRTVALYHRLRTDRSEDAPSPPIAPAAAAAPPLQPSAADLQQLGQLLTSLNELQRRVHQNIQEIERALKGLT